MVVSSHQLHHSNIHLTESLSLRDTFITHTVLLWQPLGLVVHMAQLSLGITSPSIQMPIACDSIHIIRTANNPVDLTFSFTNLAALEEIHTTEVIKTLVNNILVAKLTVRTISTCVYTSFDIHKNRCLLQMKRANETHIAHIKTLYNTSLNLCEKSWC